VAARLAIALLAIGCTISPLQRVDASSGAGGSGGTPGGDGAAGSDGAMGSCAQSVSYAATIGPWFQLRCGGCHGWTASQLVTRAPNGQKCGPNGAGANFSSSWRLVAPGDLSNSVMWWFVQDCCAPSCGASCGSACVSPPCASNIPRCGTDDPLCQSQHRTTDPERAQLECWILQGAANN
jgi:hypothetical protein